MSEIPFYEVIETIKRCPLFEEYKVYDINNDKLALLKRYIKKDLFISREQNILELLNGCPFILSFDKIFFSIKNDIIVQNLVFKYFHISLENIIREEKKK